MNTVQDTSGFYKLDGELMYGPNFVEGPDFKLERATHTEHTYPVHGWYWFDSNAEAREFFGLPPEEQNDPESDGQTA